MSIVMSRAVDQSQKSARSLLTTRARSISACYVNSADYGGENKPHGLDVRAFYLRSVVHLFFTMVHVARNRRLVHTFLANFNLFFLTSWNSSNCATCRPVLLEFSFSNTAFEFNKAKQVLMTCHQLLSKESPFLLAGTNYRYEEILLAGNIQDYQDHQ